MEGPTDRSSALRMEAVSITRSESAILSATASLASSIAATTLSTASQSSAALTAAPVEVNTPEQAKRKRRAIQMAAIEKTRPHRDRSNRTRPAQDRKRAEIRALRTTIRCTNVLPHDLDRIREQLGEKCSEAMMKRRFEEMKVLPSGIMFTSKILRSKWEAGMKEAVARWEAYKVETERSHAPAACNTPTSAAVAGGAAIPSCNDAALALIRWSDESLGDSDGPSGTYRRTKEVLVVETGSGWALPYCGLQATEGAASSPVGPMDHGDALALDAAHVLSRRLLGVHLHGRRPTSLVLHTSPPPRPCS